MPGSRSQLTFDDFGDRLWIIVSLELTHSQADDRVSSTETHARRPHKGIGQFGHRKKVLIRRRCHPRCIEFGLAQHTCEQANTPLSILKRLVDQRLKSILAVVHVGKWCVVQADEDTLRLRQCAARQDAHMLQRHGIALLRHDAADLHIAIAQAQIVELGCAPKQKILREPSQDSAW